LSWLNKAEMQQRKAVGHLLSQARHPGTCQTSLSPWSVAWQRHF